MQILVKNAEIFRILKPLVAWTEPLKESEFPVTLSNYSLEFGRNWWNFRFY